jgi:hypothetical protein
MTSHVRKSLGMVMLMSFGLVGCVADESDDTGDVTESQQDATALTPGGTHCAWGYNSYVTCLLASTDPSDPDPAQLSVLHRNQ